MKVYVDDMLVKSSTVEQHIEDLANTFAFLLLYNMRLNLEKCTFEVEAGKFLGFMVSQRGIEINPEKIQAILEMPSPKSVKDSLVGLQPLTGLSLGWQTNACRFSNYSGILLSLPGTNSVKKHSPTLRLI